MDAVLILSVAVDLNRNSFLFQCECCYCIAKGCRGNSKLVYFSKNLELYSVGKNNLSNICILFAEDEGDDGSGKSRIFYSFRLSCKNAGTLG